MNKFKSLIVSGNTEKFYFFLVWILFTSVEPFQFYAIIPNHPYKILTFITTIFFLWKLVQKKVTINYNIIIIIILTQLLYTILTIGIHLISLNSFAFEDTIIYFNLFLQLIVILIIYLFVKNFLSIRKLSLTFIKVIAIIAVLGFISIIVIYIFNIQPYSFTTRQGNRDISNFIFTFTTGRVEDNFETILRSAGYFDEPGTLAFYIIIALLLNKLYSFSKYFNYILIIAGFCTLSIAFIISIIFYIVIFGLIERKYFFVITLTTILLTMSFLIDTYKKENIIFAQLYNFTLYRLQADEDGDKYINGDNRSENMVYAYKAFIDAPLFGHGMNTHVNSKSEYNGKVCCNPLHPLATEGIFGTLIYFSIFFSWGVYIFKNGKVDYISLACWLIVLINLFQRPGFLQGPFGYFAFLLLLEATRLRKFNKILT
jgi:hypothetical protein